MLKCYCELNEEREKEDDDKEQKKHRKSSSVDVNLYALQHLKICKTGDTTSYEKFLLSLIFRQRVQRECGTGGLASVN